MNEKYKIECFTSSGELSYLNGSFEICFDGEKPMLDFIDRIPLSYTAKYYKKNNNNEWDLIGIFDYNE